MITEKLNPYDYKVDIKGKTKTYHGNMLKKYHRREEELEEDNTSEGMSVSCVSVIEEDYIDIEEEVPDKYYPLKSVGFFTRT